MKTAACVIVECIKTDRIVAITRKDGKYGFPGGKAEDGEDPSFTASRELWEEAGIHMCQLTGGPMHLLGSRVQEGEEDFLVYVYHWKTEKEWLLQGSEEGAATWVDVETFCQNDAFPEFTSWALCQAGII